MIWSFGLKKILLVILIFLVNNTVFGDDLYDIWNNFFDISGGNILPIAWDLNYSENKIFTNRLSIGLFDYYMESTRTGLGFEIMPLNYNYFQKEHMLSFIHFINYWNIFYFFNKNNQTTNEFIGGSIFGPFISIEYPIWNFQEKLSFKNYHLNIGLRYTLRPQLHLGIVLPMASIEGGYRNYNKSNNYYLSIRIHLMYLFLPLFNK